jgi:nucleoside-diphosphate-sugar epimerase
MSSELILLTGATGFIGFAVLRAALQHGYNIRAAVRSEEKAKLIRTNPVLKYVTQDQLTFVVIPDFLAEGAFDSALKDVKYIVHVASPMPGPNVSGDDDLDRHFIQPAIQGTICLYKSAQKAGNVKRIIVTSSAAAIFPVSAVMDPSPEDLNMVYGPDSRAEPVPPPYMKNTQVAYNVSKILALKRAEEFIASEKPNFDAIHIHPVVVLGRDELALTSRDMTTGSNVYALDPVRGVSSTTPFPMTVTHVDDVALAHIRALDPKVSGNQSFLLSNTGEEGFTVRIL